MNDDEFQFDFPSDTVMSFRSTNWTHLIDFDHSYMCMSAQYSMCKAQKRLISINVGCIEWK